jgi:hypothetical protein
MLAWFGYTATLWQLGFNTIIFSARMYTQPPDANLVLAMKFRLLPSSIKHYGSSSIFIHIVLSKQASCETAQKPF